MQPLSYSLQMPFLWLVMSSHDPMPLSWCRMTILITWNHIFVYHFTFVESRVTTDTPNTSHSANVACTSHFQTSKLMFFYAFYIPISCQSKFSFPLWFGITAQDKDVHACYPLQQPHWFWCHSSGHECALVLHTSSGIYVPSRRAQATWGRR